LLDRIDIHIEVPRVEATLRVDEKLSDDRLGEPSEAIRQRVEAARARQAARFEGTRMLANADMGPGEVRDLCRLDDAGKSLLKAAMQQLHMSARAYHRILKLARTMARKSGLGPGRQRRDPDGAPGRGDSVSAETADLTCRGSMRYLRHCRLFEH
jgi:magnesium chelatase family protein